MTDHLVQYLAIDSGIASIVAAGEPRQSAISRREYMARDPSQFSMVVTTWHYVTIRDLYHRH